MTDKIQMNVRVTAEQKDVLSKVLDLLREDSNGERVEDLENWLSGFANLNIGDLKKILAKRDTQIYDIEERLTKLEKEIANQKPN